MNDGVVSLLDEVVAGSFSASACNPFTLDEAAPAGLFVTRDPTKPQGHSRITAVFLLLPLLLLLFHHHLPTHPFAVPPSPPSQQAALRRVRGIWMGEKARRDGCSLAAWRSQRDLAFLCFYGMHCQARACVHTHTVRTSSELKNYLLQDLWDNFVWNLEI